MAIYVQRPAKAKSKKGKQFRKAITFAGIIVGLLVGIGALILWPKQAKEGNKTPEQKREEREFIGDVFIPPIGDYRNGVVFEFGGNVMVETSEALFRGTDFKPNNMTFGDVGRAHQAPFNLKLLLQGNRLYISAVFNDLETENEVGRIEHNKWQLVNLEYLHCYRTDTSFKVIDRRGDVIFFLKYKAPNIFSINGYFFKEGYVVVASDQINSFKKDDKTNAKIAIDQMTTDIEEGGY